MVTEQTRTLSEREARLASSNGLIKGAKAIEDQDGFKLLLRVGGFWCFLSPRRDMYGARKFKHFEILTAKYRSIHPTDSDDIDYVFKEAFKK